MAFGASSRTTRPRFDRERPKPRPLDLAALDSLAIHYVGRFATTRAKLAVYLRRKLRERGGEGVGDAEIDTITARCVAAGYVDDDAFAEQRAASLGRRGYGHRRIAMTLGAAGIDPAVVEALAPDEEKALAAAERFARRRRIGRFGSGTTERDERQRQFAAMLRAGHSAAIAARVIAEPPVTDRDDGEGD